MPRRHFRGARLGELDAASDRRDSCRDCRNFAALTQVNQMLSSSSVRRFGQGPLLLLSLLSGLGVAYWVGSVSAEGIPEQQPLFYSGVLEEDGELINDTRKLNIGLYSADEGGSPECETGSVDTQIEQGHFRVLLPDDCVQAVSANPDLWVQVETNDAVLGRTKIGAVPYAVESKNAQLLGHRPAHDFVRWQQQERRIEVGASDFRPTMGAGSISLFPTTSTNSMPRWVLDSAADVHLSANVQLPVGARLTDVSCHYWSQGDARFEPSITLYLNSVETGERLPLRECRYLDSNHGNYEHAIDPAPYFSIPFGPSNLLRSGEQPECVAPAQLWESERSNGTQPGDILGIVVRLVGEVVQGTDGRFFGCSVEYDFVDAESF